MCCTNCFKHGGAGHLLCEAENWGFKLEISQLLAFSILTHIFFPGINYSYIHKIDQNSPHTPPPSLPVVGAFGSKLSGAELRHFLFLLGATIRRLEGRRATLLYISGQTRLSISFANFCASHRTCIPKHLAFRILAGSSLCCLTTCPKFLNG